MTEFTVLLDDQTVGKIIADSIEVGAVVTVELHDENGNKITKTSAVADVLCEK